MFWNILRELLRILINGKDVLAQIDAALSIWSSSDRWEAQQVKKQKQRNQGGYFDKLRFAR